MKKSIYLLTSCFILCQSAQAMETPDFDMFEDEDGFKSVQFKKTGGEFNPNMESFMQDPASGNIQQIYFDEGISYEDQVKVFDDLCNRLNLVHVGNANTEGFLENATTNHNMVYYINHIKKNPSRVFQNCIDLDLSNLSKPQFSYLPFFHNIVEGMDKVESLHFSLRDIQKNTIKPLSMMLLQNPKIEHVFFEGEGRYISEYNSIDALADLLFIPKKMTYYFDVKFLSSLPIDALNRQLKGISIEGMQKCSPKTVVPLVHQYLGDSRNNWGQRYYNAVCESPVYSKTFKISWVDLVNENEQKRHLEKMLKSTNLHTQREEMDAILKKETLGYKALSIYGRKFTEINKILNQQLALVKQGEDSGVFDASLNDQLQDAKVKLILEMIEHLS